MTVVDELNPEGVALVKFDQETIDTLSTLHAGDVATAVALKLPVEMEYDAYEVLGTALGAFDRACKWWVGDWLIHGEELFPDRYEQAAKLTGLSEHTLLNRVTISRAIPSERRRPLVSYSCHALVSKFNADKQTEWLDYAERNQSTVSELSAAIKEAAKSQQAGDSGVETPDVGSGGVMIDRLIEVCRMIVGSAEVAGENVIVKRDFFAQLVAALGEEED